MGRCSGGLAERGSSTSIRTSKIDLPEARVVIDRGKRLANHKFDLARRPGIGHIARWAYVNQFQLFMTGAKVIPQIGDKGSGDTGSAARLENQNARRPVCLDLHPHRDQYRTAHAESVSTAKCGAYLRRRGSPA